jgi:hypothetical protein
MARLQVLTAVAPAEVAGDGYCRWRRAWLVCRFHVPGRNLEIDFEGLTANGADDGDCVVVIGTLI